MNRKKQNSAKQPPIAIFKIPTFQFYAPQDIVGIPGVFVRVEYNRIPETPDEVTYEAYAQVGQHDELCELACWGTVPYNEDEIKQVEVITNCIIHNLDFVQTVKRIKHDNDRYDRHMRKQARRHLQLVEDALEEEDET